MDALAIVADFVRKHAVWAPVAAFVIAFLESLPFVGLFIPGTSTLLGLGAAVALMGGSVPAVIAGAAAGAVLGTWISYAVGRAYGDRLSRHPFLLRRPKILATCESLFHRHGAMSVVIARFLPVLRPMTPMVAGAFGLEPRRFHLVNLASVIIWAPAFIVPGALTGMAAGAIGGRAALTLLVLFVGAGLMAWLLARTPTLLRRLGALARDIRTAVLRRTETAPVWISATARLGLHPDKAGWRALILAALLFALLILYVLNLAADVLSRRPIVQADLAVVNLLWELRTAWLDQVMTVVSALGDGGLRLGVSVLVVAYLGFQRRYREASAVAGGMIAVAVLVPVFKGLFQVARPTSIYSGIDAYSFPSGHAASAACLCLLLAWVVARPLRRPLRRMVWSVAIAAALLTGVSRIYLGAHWPSDVVAGFALGGAIAIAAIQLAARETRLAFGGPRQAAAILACVIVISVIAGPGAFHRAQILYAPYLAGAGARTTDIAALDRILPDRRTDLLGNAEEKFSALWIGDLAALQTALRHEGWSSAPNWKPSAALGFLDSVSDIRRLPALPTMHQGRFAALTMASPQSSRDAREVLRLWPAGLSITQGQGLRIVYIGSLTREVAARPTLLFTTIQEHDETSLPDATIARLAPLNRSPHKGS